MSIPPTFHELKEALHFMKPIKIAGPDNVPLELVGLELKIWLMLLMHKIWEDKTVPGDFKNANIVTTNQNSVETIMASPS